MNVVLDTNVLISAFLKPQSKPAKILRLILQGNMDIELIAKPHKPSHWRKPVSGKHWIPAFAGMTLTGFCNWLYSHQ